MGEIHEIGRPSIEQELRERLIASLKFALELAEAGEIDALVMVLTKPDHTFLIEKQGTMRKTETMGYLVQALWEMAAT